MTGLELGLIGTLGSVGVFIAGRLSNFKTVKKEACLSTHTSLKELLTEKFDNVDDKLEQINKKLDKE